MKFILTIIALTLLFSFLTFSQDIDHPKVLPNRFTSENIQEIYISDPDSIDGFNAKDSRTTVNKTELENGFLLIEEIHQGWDGFSWVNGSKLTYTYDGNNICTEMLNQHWDGSAWPHGLHAR